MIHGRRLNDKCVYIYILYTYIYIYGLHLHFCLDYIMLDKSKEKRNCKMMFFFSPERTKSGPIKNNKSAKAALEWFQWALLRFGFLQKGMGPFWTPACSSKRTHVLKFWRKPPEKRAYGSVETGYKPGLATNYQNTLRSISWANATQY